jgi:hypothetical protein
MFYWLLLIASLNTSASSLFAILNQHPDGLVIWGIKFDLYADIFNSNEGIIG